jgi:hypothetical protein
MSEAGVRDRFALARAPLGSGSTALRAFARNDEREN